MKTIAVTGTKGKTTTCHLIKAMLERDGCKAGMLGSLRYYLGSREVEADLTTPSREDTDRYIGEMAAAGCDWAIVEASSHGIHQGRVAGLDFDIAVCTNIHPEHLEYHGTFEEYQRVKASLFSGLRESAVAVVNGEDEGSETVAAGCRCDVRAFGCALPDCWAFPRTAALDHSCVDFGIGAHSASGVKTTLVGPWGLSNMMAAATAAVAAGVRWESVVAAVETFGWIDGRMEWVPVPAARGFAVVVDDAHTPPAVRNVLCFLRAFCRRRLIAVVSQRGDRYAEKLPLIGRVAEEVSDRILVSAHGPDTGDYDRVIRATLAGLRDPEAAVSGVDRPFLLAAALGTARPGDIVVSLYRGPNAGPDGLPSDRALFQSLL